jgi:3-phosphoshikimate 1-carboxyvinyltransferase
MTGRALAAALLSRGLSEIENPSLSDDGLVSAEVIEALGARIDPRGHARGAEGPTAAETGENRFFVHGTGRDGLGRPEGVLNCRESGLAMRIFTPIAALIPGRTTLVASGSLITRPMGMMESLAALGASCVTDNGHAPIIVRGPLKGGHASIDGSVTSQFLSGLLMALPLCETDSLVTVVGLKSLPYVRMTVQLLRAFGVEIDHDDALGAFAVAGNQAYRPSACTVEGDWSGASFLLVAGAIAGDVTVRGLDPASLQADRAIIDVLAEAGARVDAGRDHVSVERCDLRAFHVDATACPDLFPPLVALAGACEGTSVIHGLDRLTHKESDRARALSEEFGKMGIAVRPAGNAMEVRGGCAHGALVDSHNDHRIAMACAVAGLVAKGRITLTGSSCVHKSYPAFFSDLAALGVES